MFDEYFTPPLIVVSPIQEAAAPRAVVLAESLVSTSINQDAPLSICLCARYQAKPTEKHLNAVKRIFRYLKGTINMGLWYSKDTGMSMTAYADADHAGC
ncbi:hypothetical protein Tco_0256814 [Tanacetum coccineum]